MSQFDYPRINFAGQATVSPCTANNVNEAPLIFYDPVSVKTVIPPRVFLSGGTLKPPFTIEDLKKALPPGSLQQEGTKIFFTIDSIQDKSSFDEWVITPLGQCALDAAYHQAYPMIPTPTMGDNESLSGAIPGYWNYFGDEGFKFINVKVLSVALPDQNGDQVYGAEEKSLPEDLAALIGADLLMNEAYMVDITPSTSSFTQIFCKSMSLQKETEVFFSGTPLKGNLRTINLSRIVNEEMPQSGSGDIFTVIPISHLEGAKHSPIIRLFEKFTDPSKPLKGLFIRYNLFENEEIRPFDYLKNGKVANPAKLQVAGSISPWYEGEMKSIGLGRQLVYHQALLGTTFVPPLMTRMDYEQKLFHVDLFNGVPERRQDDGSYEVVLLGTIEFRLQLANGVEKPLGRLNIGPDTLNRAENIQRSGIFTFPLNISREEGQSGRIGLYLINSAGEATRIMDEDEYTLFTDQAAIYTNAGDDPYYGYHSYSGKKEPCRLRVMYRGEPLQEPAPFTLVEFAVKQQASLMSATIFRHTYYKDKDIVTFPTDQAANAVYLFLPGHTWQVPKMNFAAIFITGYVVHLRVLPRGDYGRYFDPNDPQYPTPVTFEVLYEEIFQAYDYAYPIMGQIIPFTKENYDNPKMAKELLKRVDLNNWGNYAYMPVTRELSDDQRALIRKWAVQFV
jgi:hypothetical protein